MLHGISLFDEEYNRRRKEFGDKVRHDVSVNMAQSKDKTIKKQVEKR
jgi:hypothetical protein